MEWYWLAEYTPKFIDGLWITIKLLVISIVLGMSIAIPVGLVRVTGPTVLAGLAHGFCVVIRGTPLLIQLWLIYYGLGSVFPAIPGIRESFIWPLLRDAFPYAIVAFALSVGGYSGEVMRSAFKSVSKGELEAARAFGMSPFTLLRRVWLPRAIQNVLPTLTGEFILTLKATPLAATITVIDVYGVGNMVRQETFRIYEPLLLIAGIYIVLSVVIIVFFRWIERRNLRYTTSVQ